jgi:phosphoribosylaminoimidazole-succinocarboxamide synthase
MVAAARDAARTAAHRAAPNMNAETVFETELRGLTLLHRGKVRDLYALDERRMLIVATDRLSAFDVVLPDPIPDKGRVLTGISNFWFAHLAGIVPNHLTTDPVEAWVKDAAERRLLAGRSMVVERLKTLPLEAVVRGYLCGSGFKDYERTGGICGIALPRGLVYGARLPMPIFTPATKAQAGQHDENVDFDAIVAALGLELAEAVRSTSLALYSAAASHALARGIIIADTKFEFGLDSRGRLVLIDECLTPDSSRFWPVAGYTPGSHPPSFDKQYVRDYLETLDWNKTAPGPRLPPEVIRVTSEKYREAKRILLGA